MGFENFNIENESQDTLVVPEESSNRTFLIVAAVLGGIAILALVCVAVMAAFILPRQKAQQAANASTLEAQKTEVELIVGQTATSDQATAIALGWTATPTRTPIPPTPTITPTLTPVVVMPNQAAAPTIGSGDATATSLAATLNANATLYVATLTAGPTLRVPTPTAIPTTGFADEVGLPTMLGMAALLIVVIFLARRLRTA